MKVAFRIRTKSQEEADKIERHFESFFESQGWVPGDVEFYTDATPRVYSERIREMDLMRDISLGKVPEVVCPSLDHIGKSLKDLDAFISLCKEKKISVSSIAEHIDSDKTGYLFELKDVIRYLNKRQGMDTALGLVNSGKPLGRPAGLRDDPMSPRQVKKRKRLQDRLKELDEYKRTFKKEKVNV